MVILPEKNKETGPKNHCYAFFSQRTCMFTKAIHFGVFIFDILQ